MPTFTNSVSGDENAIVGTSTSGIGVWGGSQTSSGVGGMSDSGVGVHGVSKASPGVRGDAEAADGVLGFSKATGHAGVAGANDDGDGVGVYGRSAKQAGVYGESKGFNGVRGVSYAPGHGAVVGVSEVHNQDPTNHPENNAGPGVYGQSDGAGVWGLSKTWHGVYGESPSSTGGAGVWGEHKANGVGVFGHSDHGRGFVGVSNAATGVEGNSTNGVGVWGSSINFEGVHAETKSPVTAAVAAYNLNPEGTGAAIFAKKEGSKGHAGFFAGNVHVTGILTVDQDICCTNADCAEDFNIANAESVEAGTVMVLGEEGVLHCSEQAYDKRVVGVVSGAGDYRPAIVLDKQPPNAGRKPIALLGKVYCKVDADYAPIQVGDLLTTSNTPGHAMKAIDQLHAFGSVIGKALRPLKEGQSLIPILIALQ